MPIDVASKSLNDTQITLIRLLADGRWVSGQILADHLQVSRTAVWKQLQSLQRVGLFVESLKGKGYRLSPDLDLLNQEQIMLALDPLAQHLFPKLDILFEIDSTNSHALSMSESNYVCFAEVQTQGRGRRQRTWLTPFAGQIAMSVKYEFTGSVNAVSGLSLVVGLCVVNALSQSGFDDAQLKWPNDILYNNQKLGGILLEVSGDISGPCQVVIGIGLNVNCNFTDEAPDQAWIDLSTIANQTLSIRNQLAAQIVNQLASVLPDYEQLGFAYYQQAWIDKDAFYGQSVQISDQASTIKGIENGVDDQGRLILTVDGVDQIFSGGEVSLRATQER